MLLHTSFLHVHMMVTTSLVSSGLWRGSKALQQLVRDRLGTYPTGGRNNFIHPTPTYPRYRAVGGAKGKHVAKQRKYATGRPWRSCAFLLSFLTMPRKRDSSRSTKACFKSFLPPNHTTLFSFFATTFLKAEKKVCCEQALASRNKITL